MLLSLFLKVKMIKNPEISEFFIVSTSALYTEEEMSEFLDHVKSAVNSRIENN